MWPEVAIHYILGIPLGKNARTYIAWTSQAGFRYVLYGRTKSNLFDTGIYSVLLSTRTTTTTTAILRRNFKYTQSFVLHKFQRLQPVCKLKLNFSLYYSKRVAAHTTVKRKINTQINLIN